MQAESLHRETAFLSNKLHTYRADDLEGVRPLIGQILARRDEWRQVIKTIDYIQKTGKLPAAPAEKPVTAGTGSISEMKLEVTRLAKLISKAKAKLQASPDHKKADTWREDLAKYEALKNELRDQITDLTYAAA